MRRLLTTLPFVFLFGCPTFVNPPGACLISEDEAPADGTPQDRCIRMLYNDCEALASDTVTVESVAENDCEMQGYTEACGEDADGEVIYTEPGGCDLADTGA